MGMIYTICFKYHFVLYILGNLLSLDNMHITLHNCIIHVCKYVCMSVCLSVCMYVCLSICLSIYLSIFLNHFISDVEREKERERERKRERERSGCARAGKDKLLLTFGPVATETRTSRLGCIPASPLPLFAPRPA